MGYRTILVDRTDPVATITLHRPEARNALDLVMRRELLSVLDELDADAACRVVVLTGAGGHFSAGGDVKTMAARRHTAAEGRARVESLNRFVVRLFEFPKPTIAMIRGYCIGGGMGLATCCDLRIATEGSKFAVPAAKLGLGYAYPGLKRLVDVVGPSFAKEIFYTARQFDSTEALQMGLVNRVVPAAGIETYVRDYAGTIGGNAPLTINSVKLSVNEATKDPEKRNLAAAQAAVDACFASADYIEGRTAFMEKRKPVFRAR